MKNKYLLLLPIFLFSFAFISGAYSGSGSGSEGDPFLITTCSQLQEMGSYLTNHFILANDIDCFDINPFTPSVSFSGSLDGKTHKIENLVISCSSEFCGLFGGYFSGSVSNLKLVDVSITGGQLHTGGIAGVNNGGINFCSVSGNIVGTSYTGGIAGENVGTISNSYSTASITGDWNSGGLVGRQTGGSISYSYSTGTVSGGGENMGGLLGLLQGGTCTSSYWDTETSGKSTSACGEGLPTEQMKDYNLFQNAGWTITYEIASENTYPYFQAVNAVETWKIEGVDDVEPIVTEQSPENNYISETTSVDFTCTATDNGEVTSIELYIDGSSDDIYEGSSYTWTKELEEGEYTWDCYACDGANNCAFGELRTITIDLPTEAETPQAVNKFWDFDIISKQEMLPSDEEAPITKISLFAGIKNFFQSIINWFSNIF